LIILRIGSQANIGRENYEIKLGILYFFCIFVLYIKNKTPMNKTFIKPDNIDGEWLSPIQSERIKQEEKLAQIFEHYPTAAPRWQYMNALIQNGLDQTKLYNEDEVLELLYKHVEDLFYGEKSTLNEWFEKNKKI
jgi:hypothetical protein